MINPSNTQSLLAPPVLLAVLLILTGMGCGESSSDQNTSSSVVNDTSQSLDASDPIDTADNEKDTNATDTAQGDSAGTLPPPPQTLPTVDFNTDNIFDAPFPSDLRRTAEGNLDLSTFPNPEKSALVDTYIDYAQKNVSGFSLTPTITFRFTDKLATKYMPVPQETVLPNSSIQLINLEEGTEEYGRRVPVEVGWWGNNPAVYIKPYTLMFNPIFGTPLKPKTRYAAFVTTEVRDPYARKILPSQTIQDALAGQGELAEHLAPFKAWVELDGNVPIEEIAMATIFTTSDPAAEMVTIAKFLYELPAPKITEIKKTTLEKPGYVLYEGRYDSPNFQAGKKPYTTDGDIRFDENNQPIIQATENLRFSLTIPKSDMPPTGWPIVIYGHGTGGDWKSYIDNATALQLTERGIAVMGIDQPLHGDRSKPELNKESLELMSFNFTNPDAARSNFRQSAIDVIMQSRCVIETPLIVPDDVSHTGEKIMFDTANTFVFGHSHGGISAGIHAPFIKGIKGIILSGGGGGLTHSVMVRKDPVDFKTLVDNAAKITNPLELTIQHPVLTLSQTIVDVTDPLSFAPMYRYPVDGSKPINILITEGTKDAQTPYITTDSLAAAARIPIRFPPSHESDAHIVMDIDDVKPPVSGNFTNDAGKSTAVLAQFEGENHWVIFNKKVARDMYIGFLVSAINDGIPTID